DDPLRLGRLDPGGALGAGLRGAVRPRRLDRAVAADRPRARLGDRVGGGPEASGQSAEAVRRHRAPARPEEVAMRPIGVLGAGSFGTAVAIQAARAGHRTLLWVRREEKAAEL